MDTTFGSSALDSSSSPLKREPPCSRCRQKKIRCDKHQPCDQCKRGGYDCLYDKKPDDTEDGMKYSVLQDRILRLEAQLRAVTSGQSVATGTPQSDDTPLDCSCGRQIFNTRFSVHYDSGMHWVDLFPNVSYSLDRACEVCKD
jgi:hypothetical protein